MRQVRHCACATAIALITCAVPLTVAHSDEMRLVPTDPWEIIHLAREHGDAQVGRDSRNDPEIVVTRKDAPSYRITFYDCWLGRECQAILLRASLERPDWRPDKAALAEWNRTKLVGRAILRTDSAAVLEHPVIMADGLPAAVLRKTFEHWHLALREFADHLDF